MHWPLFLCSGFRAVAANEETGANEKQMKKLKKVRRPSDYWKKPRSKWKKYHRRGRGLLLTESELAIKLGEEPRTIRTWRLKGIMPYLMLGHKSIRYSLDDVLAVLRKRRVGR